MEEMPPTKFFVLRMSYIDTQVWNISVGADSTDFRPYLFRFAKQYEVAKTAGKFMFDKVNCG